MQHAWTTTIGVNSAFIMTQHPTFEDVYEDEADFVYSLARRLSGGGAEAEDLFQEVFLKVHRFLPTYQGGSLRGWLRRIVVNTNTSMRRGKKNQAIAHLDEMPGWKESIPDTGDAPEQLAVQAGTREGLERALARLSEDFRTVLTLREIEDLDYAEIAELLNVPVGTVRSRLARARLALRKELEGSEVVTR